MLYLAAGGPRAEISPQELREGLFMALSSIDAPQRVLALPPDITRAHSQAGYLTAAIHEFYQHRLSDIMPALGTHTPMTPHQIGKMFGPVPLELFREHRWRTDIQALGTVPSDYIHEVSEGKLYFEWPAEVNSLLVKGRHDLILSIGQVVPHEVIGMANHNKNIFIGVGGSEAIHKSHYLGAVYGMERIMGRVDTPVRKVLNYAEKHFAWKLPIVYVLTVIGRNDQDRLVTRGLFIGDDLECFEKAAALSLKVNFSMLDAPLKKVVVYLDPEEYRSTWLGNKAIYRTRMALADNAELIILAPGLQEFGEDPTINKLIRKYGYTGTEQIRDAASRNQDLSGNLCAAAHLIHGSSEQRFSVCYAPGKLERNDIEGIGYQWADLQTISKKYNPATLREGYNMVDGEEIFYISNPALGLWASKQRFKE